MLSEKGCQWCPCRDHCPAKKQLLDIVRQPTELLTTAEKLDIFRNRKLIEKTIKQAEADLTDWHQSGDIAAGLLLKLVEKRTNRAVDEDNAVSVFGEEAYKKKVKNVAEIEKLCAKHKVEPIEVPVIYKPKGEPELALIEDEREPLAISEFKKDE